MTYRFGKPQFHHGQGHILIRKLSSRPLIIVKCIHKPKVSLTAHKAFIQPLHNTVELGFRKKLLSEKFCPNVWIEEDSHNEDVLINLLPSLLEAFEDAKL